MKYYPKGWNVFKFLVTPEELKSVLKDFHFVEFARRVPENYKETLQRTVFDKYEKLYNKLITNHKFEWKNDWAYFDLPIGITNDLKKCTHAPKFLDKDDGNWYKLNDF
jgi:hypothetical protein